MRLGGAVEIPQTILEKRMGSQASSHSGATERKPMAARLGLQSGNRPFSTRLWTWILAICMDPPRVQSDSAVVLFTTVAITTYTTNRKKYAVAPNSLD